ncbi:MAG: glycosyltransferase family 4 protein [Gemmatimonadaceae bacterium]
MKLTVVAEKVTPLGGMERAAAEVVRRVARTHDVTVIATQCEVTSDRVSWIPVPPARGPAVVSEQAFFSRAAKLVRAVPRPTVINSVMLAVTDPDVVTAQFCNAAFSARYGGLRGGARRVRRAYQSLVEQAYARRERRLYASPRLRAVIAVSQGLKRELMEFYGMPEEKIVVIPNGVDHSVFKPAGSMDAKRRLRRELDLPESAFLALFVGGDWDRKGLGDAIHAVAATPDVVLVVVGSGDVQRFQALAARAGAAARVLFAGLSRTPERYFAAADVFVVPSRYETFSMSTLEAEASGLPILASRMNGVEDRIHEGVNGYIVGTDPAAIRDKIIALRDDPALLGRMSTAAATASRRYDWDWIAAEQLAVFESVAATVAS